MDVNNRFNEVSVNVADIRGAIGELSSQVKDYHDEMSVGFHQMGNIKLATLQIAHHTGVKLATEL